MELNGPTRTSVAHRCPTGTRCRYPYRKLSGPIDTLEIRHEAHSREGFALGAVIAAEWLAGKSGIFSMNDVLNIKA